MKILTIKAKDTESGSQNVYIIEGEKMCVLIDAGVKYETIKEHTTLPIKAVLITHAHYDHIEYIEEYDKAGVPIYLSKNSIELLNNIKANASDLFDNPKVFKLDNCTLLENEQEFRIIEFDFKFYSTPGHTADSGCYLLKHEKILFSGDTLFGSGIGRVDLPTGSKEELKESLEKILNVDYSEIYPGHGDKSDKETQDKLIPKWQRYLNIIR